MQKIVKINIHMDFFMEFLSVFELKSVFECCLYDVTNSPRKKCSFYSRCSKMAYHV